MQVKKLSVSQKSEQHFLVFALGWLLLKIELHLRYCPEGTAQQSMLSFFKFQIPKLREELCFTNKYVEFERKIEHFRNSVRSAGNILDQSKEVIIAHRLAHQLEPAWPPELASVE
ncbi:unnamed protein product [Caenorhabditis sp. 36 PRJEB53466]|nr:unnamed protein product [Caenorhabditis sp. 36 PRJEB53466]